MSGFLRDFGGTTGILVLILWFAVTALSSLVLRTLGAARLKQYPVTTLAVVLSLLSVPAAGVMKIARPHTGRIIALFRHTEAPSVDFKEQCSMFPGDNVWNVSIRQLPVDSHSAGYIAGMGPDAPLHADFGARGGFPLAVLKQDESPAEVTFTDGAAESDPGPYRIPDNAPIEGDGAGDAHVLIVDTAHCQLYELFAARRLGPKRWLAGSGAIFDLRSNKLRPNYWTSADAAGLPITPGLVRYDEVKAGAIRHALRFTTPHTRNGFIWPARHRASSNADPNVPPMGQRFRLRASFDIARFSPETRVILTALQEYGMFVSDNGGRWFVSGTMDSRWPSQVFKEFKEVHGSDFEAVDESTLMADPDSGQVKR